MALNAILGYGIFNNAILVFLPFPFYMGREIKYLG